MGKEVTQPLPSRTSRKRGQNPIQLHSPHVTKMLHSASHLRVHRGQGRAKMRNGDITHAFQDPQGSMGYIAILCTCWPSKRHGLCSRFRFCHHFGESQNGTAYAAILPVSCSLGRRRWRSYLRSRHYFGGSQSRDKIDIAYMAHIWAKWRHNPATLGIPKRAIKSKFAP